MNNPDALLGCRGSAARHCTGLYVPSGAFPWGQPGQRRICVGGSSGLPWWVHMSNFIVPCSFQIGMLIGPADGCSWRVKRQFSCGPMGCRDGCGGHRLLHGTGPSSLRFGTVFDVVEEATETGGRGQGLSGKERGIGHGRILLIHDFL